MPEEEMEVEEIEEKDDHSYEKPAYAEEIAEIIKSSESLKDLKERLFDYHENDIADALPLLTSTERKKLYRSIGMEQTSEIFTYLDDASFYLEEV